MSTLITGVAGQDGSYLAELVCATDERVYGVIFPHAPVPDYVTALQRSGRLGLIACDLADTVAWRHLLRELRPHRIFHLAAISAPTEAGADVQRSRRVNVDSVEALLDWMRRDAPGVRTLLLSSATIFGGSAVPQSEATPVQAVDEYGVQKTEVRRLAFEARRSGLYVACAIPFNHESLRRDERFVFAKVCYGAARIARGEQDKLRLGSLSVRRDWGYAPEFCRAFVAMLQTAQPQEFVLATGEGHSVRELAETALARVGLSFDDHVVSDFALQRPGDFDLVGDASRAEQELGWKPQVRFKELVELLVDGAM